MKRFLHTAISSILCAAIFGSLAACANSSVTIDYDSSRYESGDEKIVLKVWHQWSNDSNQLKKIFEDALENYTKSHPNITFKEDYLDTEAYKTKINMAFAGSSADVDVFYYWGGGRAKKLVRANRVLPLDEYVKDGTLDKLVDRSTTAFTFDGKLYGLPCFSWTMVLYCNKEIFDQNGLQIPKTYDELLEVSKKLSAKGILPLACGAKDSWNAAFVYEALANREVGADGVNSFLAGKAKFDDPGYAEAAKKVIELVDTGAFGKNALATSNDEADAMFVGGKAAMRLTGSWFANNIYESSDSVVRDKVVAVQIPLIPDGKGTATDFQGGYIEGFFINANTKYKKESVEFCKYINKVMGNAAAENSLGFTAWKDEINTGKWNPLMEQIAEMLKSQKTTVLAWDTSLDEEAATVHLEAVQALFGKKITPEEFVKVHQR